MDEKAAAVHAIGAFAEHTKKKILPYLDKIVKDLLALVNYFHEDVREGVAKAFYRIAIALYDAFPPPTPYQKGVSVKIRPMVTEHQQYVNIVVPEMINVIQNDDDVEVVTTVMECITQIFKVMGIGAVEPRNKCIVYSICRFSITGYSNHQSFGKGGLLPNSSRPT